MIIGAAAAAAIGRVAAPTTAFYDTLLLNGTSQYVNCGQDASITLGDGDKSHSIWFKTSSASALQIFNQGDPTANGDYYDIYMNFGEIYARAEELSNGRAYKTNSTYNDDAWHHLVILWNSFGTYNIYVDGASVAITQVASSTFTNIDNASSDLSISGRIATSSQYFDGSLSSPMIFNTTLSPANITELYNSGIAKQPWEYSSSITNNYALALPLNNGVASGREAEDFSGNENDGTLVGSPTYTGSALTYNIATKYNAFLYDGSTEYVDCGTNVIDLQNIQSSSYTLSAWINTTETTGTQFFRASGNGPSGTAQICMQVNSFGGTLGTNDKVSIALYDGAWTGQQIASTTNVNDGSWYHVVGTWESSSNTIKIFVNGVEENSLVITAPNQSTSAEKTFIDISYSGNLAQPMIFNTVLSASEVATLYNKNLPLQYDQIPTSITNNSILAYAMNSNDNSLTDLSTGGNNGTAVGGVTSDGAELDWKTV